MSDMDRAEIDREIADSERDQRDEYRERLDPNADPDCPYCHGLGYVTDWVPYGSTNVPMNTGCECLPDPDAMYCSECGKAREDLDENDVCPDCGGKVDEK
jgi:hypothetical protein